MKKQKEKTCFVCGVVLNEKNQYPIEPIHFSEVCLEHKEYATTFLTEVIAEQLGFKEPTEKKCLVCGKILSFKEVQDCLKINSFNLVCEKHFNYSKIYNIEGIINSCKKLLKINKK